MLVTLIPPTNTAAMYYTLDGSVPTTNSFAYTGPIHLGTSATLSANAWQAGYNNSVAASAVFTLPAGIYFTGNGTFLTNHQFQLTFSGTAGNTYVLQASTNLVNWVPISTNMPASNVFNLIDSNAQSFPQRFYRVIQQ